jgi:hypothetical protein
METEEEKKCVEAVIFGPTLGARHHDAEGPVDDGAGQRAARIRQDIHHGHHGETAGCWLGARAGINRTSPRGIRLFVRSTDRYVERMYERHV